MTITAKEAAAITRENSAESASVFDFIKIQAKAGNVSATWYVGDLYRKNEDALFDQLTGLGFKVVRLSSIDCFEINW